MPRVDVSSLPHHLGSRYPAPFAAPCATRDVVRLGDAGGLTRVGVNLVRLPPGAWSSQRHWHSHEDELVWILEGEVVLVEDEGETVLRVGDCAAFPAGTRNGHHLQNRRSHDAVVLTVGTRDDADHGEYPDVDLAFTAGRYSGGGAYTHKDGTPRGG